MRPLRRTWLLIDWLPPLGIDTSNPLRRRCDVLPGQLVQSAASLPGLFASSATGTADFLALLLAFVLALNMLAEFLFRIHLFAALLALKLLLLLCHLGYLLLCIPDFFFSHEPIDDV